MSVGAHLVAYGGRDDKLFRGAISESGFSSAGQHYPTLDEWQPIYDYVVKSTSCTGSSDTLACLRTIPTWDLSAVFNSTFNGSNIGSDSNLAPQIDGDFLQKSGTTHLQNGEFVKVPYLMGTNFDEGGSFGTEGINTTAEFIEDILSHTPTMDNETLNIILALYPDIPSIGIPATLQGRPSPESGYGFQWKREAAYIGDLKMHAARRLASQSWAKHNATAYSYHFNVLVNGIDAEVASAHYNEVAFVFDNTLGLGYHNAVASDPFESEPESFEQLAKIMSRMWVGFIANLDPNQAGGKLPSPLPAERAPINSLTRVPSIVTDINWPRYTLEDPRNIVFDVNVTDLLYTEPDTFRAEGINFIMERLSSVFKQ